MESLEQYRTNSEEADCRIWRHAIRTTANKVLICSPDTDVYNIGLTCTSPTISTSKRYLIQINVPSAIETSFLDMNALHNALVNDPDLGSIPKPNLPTILQSLFICTGCDFISFFKQETFPVSDYEDAVSSKEGYYHWMRQVNLYGVTLMKNIPVADQQLVKLCEQIGEPQDHPFLRVFEVRAVPNASNLAYTNNELIPHLDQNMLENAPGIQFFACLRFDDCVEGGESIIIDTYPIIEEFRIKHPKQFDVLTRVPYTPKIEHHSLDRKNTSVSYLYSTPHIRLDSSKRVIGVSWSPQIHAPLSVSEKDTEEYYEAFILLSSMFDNSPRKMIHRLRPGEAIISNNRRVLHSRNAFSTNGGERHLQSFYISIDNFRSKFAVLTKELNKDEPIKHFFNNSYIA